MSCDSSASKTFSPNGTATDIDYGWLLISANAFQDTFSSNGLDVENQAFLNAYRVQPVGSSWDDIASVHGVMGLTPRSTGSGLKLLSPFMTMASQGLLDENIISLRLREPRESTLGGINHELFMGNITRIPITNHTSPYSLTGRWQAEGHVRCNRIDTGY